MPFVVKFTSRNRCDNCYTCVFCYQLKEIAAVFCDREDALEYIKNNKDDFEKDDEIPLLEYWNKNDLLKTETYFDLNK
jgi:hypothetical protein